MKSVLISIQPKWCELIASGKKMVEIRKTKPKIETPFKCYIYCTKGDWLTSVNGKVQKPNNMVIDLSADSKVEELNGKVIGEFMCDAIFPMSVWYSNPNDRLSHREYPFTCLTDKEIMDYLGNGVEGYAWHITDLVIYDKPKDLIEFCVWKKCNSCRDTGYESTACRYDEDCKVPAVISRPPQSWCYVEGGGSE